MFCPNCGKDCGADRICAGCGMRFQEPLEKKRTDQPRVEKDYGMPYGKYAGVHGFIILNENHLVIRHEINKKVTETTIPYDKLTKVLLFREQNWARSEYLLLRWEGNSYIPIPEWGWLFNDKTTISGCGGKCVHYHIYHILVLLAPNSAEIGVIDRENNAAKIETLRKHVDLAPYFEKYNPCRDIAVKVLRENTGLKKKDAELVIQSYFDERQNALYAQDPNAAYRDLYRVKHRLTPENKIKSKELKNGIELTAAYRKDSGNYNYSARSDGQAQDLFTKAGENHGTPYGKYAGVHGFIILNEDHLIIRHEINKEVTETTIPYDKLTKVLFFREQNWARSEYLLLRWEGNSDMPIPKWRWLFDDKTTINDSCCMRALYHIYHILVLLAPNSAEIGVIDRVNNPAKIEALRKYVDLAPYFEKYNPCRDIAAKALRKDTGLKKKEAELVIQSYFDERQNVLYAQDPNAACRDLYRAINKITPARIEWEQKWKELYFSGTVFCPQCLSTKYTIGERGFDVRKSAIYGRVAPGAGLFAGFIGASDPMFVCRKCGHKWEPK